MTVEDLRELVKIVIQGQHEFSTRYKITDACSNEVYLDAFTDGVYQLSDAVQQWIEDHEEA